MGRNYTYKINRDGKKLRGSTTTDICHYKVKPTTSTMKWLSIQYGSYRITRRDQVRITVTDNVEFCASKATKGKENTRKKENMVAKGRSYPDNNRRHSNAEQRRVEQKRKDRKEQENKKKSNKANRRKSR